MRKTKIVCTLGPVSASPEALLKLLEAGMDVARLNLSHRRPGEVALRLEAVRAAEFRTGRPVAVLLDTRGPQLRTGDVPGGGLDLEAGQEVVLGAAAPPAGPAAGRVPWLPAGVAGLDRLPPGTEVRVGEDGPVLVVEGPGDGGARCRVARGGRAESRCRLTLSGPRPPLPPLAPEDLEDLREALPLGVDFVAASFVRDAQDVREVRGALEREGSTAAVVAKVEAREGVENLRAVLEAADAIMVARGDLGVEFPPEEVPLIQKRIIALANRAGKPVITATQMLESMVTRPHPTRAEASDVANAVFDGTDAVMLSEETAVGEHFEAATAVMARIAARAEEALPYRAMLNARAHWAADTITDAISYATCATADRLGARAIVTPTQSGHTARMVARYRPRAPIAAVTPDPAVGRRLALSWGVWPLLSALGPDTDATLRLAVEAAVRAGAAAEGDLVVVTAGVPVGVPGTTNMMKVHRVGDPLPGSAVERSPRPS